MIKKIFEEKNIITFIFESNKKIKGIIKLDTPNNNFLYPELENSTECLIYNSLRFEAKKYFNRSIRYVINFCQKFKRKRIIFFFEFGDKSLGKLLLKNNFYKDGEFYIYDY